MTLLDDKLRTWATGPRQLEIFDAVQQHGGYRAAARALDVDPAVVLRSVQRLKARAAFAGYSPEHDMTRTVPDGYTVKGVSTYYDAEGKARGQWVKSRVDADRAREMVEETVRVLTEEIRGMGPITPAPRHADADLLAVYPFGDPHIGMYSWAAETGENFDLGIARRLTLGAVDRLVASAPAAHTALILPLGDVFHMDDQTNQTPAHKHQLDADGRYVKVLGVGIEIFRHVIIRALEKHQRVVVRFVRGNHDPHAVWALAFTIAAWFASDPRVEVDLSPADHWYFRFGKVLIGTTHGDKSKPDKLPGIMAADRARDWGETTHRVWYTGHVHHHSVREYPGVMCESFRTLAAADAYAAGYGYRAGRDMLCIVHHREHGEVERHRCDVGQISATPTPAEPPAPPQSRTRRSAGTRGRGGPAA